jgi:hypothetical protein
LSWFKQSAASEATTVRKADIWLPAYVSGEVGAAELQISRETCDRYRRCYFAAVSTWISTITASAEMGRCGPKIVVAANRDDFG